MTKKTIDTWIVQKGGARGKIPYHVGGFGTQDHCPHLSTPSVPSRNFRPALGSFKVRETRMFAIRL